MKELTFTEAQNRFEELIEIVQQETLLIKRDGKVIAYIVSSKTYQDMVDKALQAQERVKE